MGRRLPALVLMLLATAVPCAFAHSEPPSSEPSRPAPIFSTPEIDAGFRQLYELRFAEAREQFEARQRAHPEEPLGEVSIAASYLFEEFYRQGVLSSDFFLNDKRLLGGIEGKPDEDRTRAFLNANRRAQELAFARLKVNPQDPGALYALTLAAGMQADYSGILQKRHLESLHWIKQAEGYAKELLMVEPDAQDAWLALGAADYIIGSQPAPKRFFLRLGGIHGNRSTGLDELRRTAEKGHYLRPYARMLLGLVALRERQEEVAREQFIALGMEFPGNPLFAAELERLDHRREKVEGEK